MAGDADTPPEAKVSPTTKPSGAPSPTSDHGRVALVTGAAGGLGPACCAALAARGMTVVATDVAADRADAVATELTDSGAHSEGHALDVTDRHAVDAFVASMIDRHGRLDVVVNLAGVIRNAVTHRIDDDDHHLVMATHVDGVLNTMRAAIVPMREAGYGRIVNPSSIAVRGSVAGASYGAAKGAIEGLTRSTAMEVARHGITVNCVAPGLINAGMFTTVPEDYQRESLARVPAGRAGEPEEVAACVAFLASAEAGYVTGQTLFICGGATLGF